MSGTLGMYTGTRKRYLDLRSHFNAHCHNHAMITRAYLYILNILFSRTKSALIYEEPRAFRLQMDTAGSARDRMSVHGQLVDDETRCVHWHSPLDVIAIKFRCCKMFYACYDCHKAEQSHTPQRYHVKQDSEEHVVLCGACFRSMTFDQYAMGDDDGATVASTPRPGLACPFCKHQFNPGCRFHYGLYFDGIQYPKKKG